MELGPQNHSRDGLMGPNSIMVVYMDPLGKQLTLPVNCCCYTSPFQLLDKKQMLLVRLTVLGFGFRV